jgi:hypothetical protein
MIDISVGAVGAAFVAGLVSLLGLVIGKEQKISEFRQVWIDDLRKCLVSYLVNINAIVDMLRVQKTSNNPSSSNDSAALLASYRALNEASHGIILRINLNEAPAKALRTCMANFEKLATSNDDLTPEKIRIIEEDFVRTSGELLKFEWRRVKTGERTFVWTKRLVVFSLVMMGVFMAFLAYRPRLTFFQAWTWLRGALMSVLGG